MANLSSKASLREFSTPERPLPLPIPSFPRGPNFVPLRGIQRSLFYIFVIALLEGRVSSGVLLKPVLEHGGELVLRGCERLGEVDPVEAPLARLQRDPAADQRHHLPVAHLGHQRHPRTRRVRRRER